MIVGSGGREGRMKPLPSAAPPPPSQPTLRAAMALGQPSMLKTPKNLHGKNSRVQRKKSFYIVRV